MKRNKSERLFLIINYLSNHDTATASELAEYCQVSVRSIYRDIKTLQDIGYYFIIEGKNGYKLIHKPIQSPYNLTANEWMALVVYPIVSGKMNLVNDPLLNSYHSAIKKIEKNVRNNYKLPPISDEIGKRLLYNEQRKTSDPKIMSTIVESITNNKTVRVSYYSIYRNVITKRKLDPYYLVPRGGHLYLIAFCHYREGIRTFRVSRIREIELTENTFQIPDDFSINEFLANRWSIFAEEEKPIRFVVKFSKNVSKYVYEYEFYTDTILIEQEDESLILKTEVKSKLEFLRWIRSFGLDAEVLEPNEVREDLKREFIQLLKKYEKKI